MSLSWKPVKRGRNKSIFCSPACGHDCTREAYKEAIQWAKDTIAMMQFGNWKVRVWENLGWHSSIVSNGGHLTIYIFRYDDGEGSYHTAYDPEGKHGGTPMPYSVGKTNFKDPNEAVRAQIKQVRKVLDKEIKGFQTVLQAAAGF